MRPLGSFIAHPVKIKLVEIEKYISSIPSRVIIKFCQFHKIIHKLNKNKAGGKINQSAKFVKLISVFLKIISLNSMVLFFNKKVVCCYY